MTVIHDQIGRITYLEKLGRECRIGLLALHITARLFHLFQEVDEFVNVSKLLAFARLDVSKQVHWRPGRDGACVQIAPIASDEGCDAEKDQAENENKDSELTAPGVCMAL